MIAPRVASRARVLSDEELRRVWQASGALRPKSRAYVRLSILTAARQIEVADKCVAEVDRSNGRWTLPPERAKNGRGITLPLGALALTELGARLKRRLDELSGVGDWCWHDLRRTACTGMTRLGVPREHAEAALNHVSGRTPLERTYDRHDFAPSW